MKSEPLTLAFAGTPDIAAFILQALITQSPHRLKQIYTQPDRKAGRGKKLLASPVKQLAQKHGFPLAQPSSATAMDVEMLGSCDALIVVAYGMLLPETVLSAPKSGCLNVHTSLLPRWRGAAPIQRSIQAGDSETGISVMQMDTGLDTGPVLQQARCSITADETAGSLHDKLARLGASCLLTTLDKLADGKLTATAQNDEQSSYAAKISKAEAELDWSQPAEQLERTIRAFNPTPVAYTTLNGHHLRIWSAQVIDDQAEGRPGSVLTENQKTINVVTGRGILRLLTVQAPGKRPQDATAFLNGRPGFFSGKPSTASF